MWKKSSAAIAAMLVFALSSAKADFIVDLTSPGGSSGFAQGALFQWTPAQPTGTGFIQSFVRIESNSAIEQGYNTDFRPVQFNEKIDATFTHSIVLSQVPTINIGGVGYRQFLLDINQTGSSPLLSLDQLQIFLGSTGNLTGYDLATRTLPGATLIYDLDVGPQGPTFIKLDFSLNSGSGSGDMLANIPDALFTGPNQFVYLFSRFGDNFPNNDGFEEWAVTQQAIVVPEPSSIVLVLSGLATIGLGGMRRLLRRRPTAAGA